jgi:8-oxo-dGTP pyrophosphatase MutT (NUDIX family)
MTEAATGPAESQPPLTPPDDGLVPRLAARVLLLDGADRVLLLRGHDLARPEHRYWFTVGGGLDAGESLADGAIRELYEETGLRLRTDELIGPVHREVTRFPFDGRWYAQEQEFFVARVSAWEVDRSGWNAVERATIDATRWWSADELDVTGERFYPPDLPALLRTVARVA